MIFFIPSRILILTLDTDLKEDTPSIPVFFCFWMHYYYTYYHISRGVYHFHSRVFCHIWDGSCKTHFWTPRKWSRLRLDHFLGVQKCVLQLPSHTLILTLDTQFTISHHHLSKHVSILRLRLHFTNGCKIPSPSWTFY